MTRFASRAVLALLSLTGCDRPAAPEPSRQSAETPPITARVLRRGNGGDPGSLDPQAAADHPIQYGLIAEEVAKVFPDLVVYDRNGQVETVAYHLLTPLLLNELQKERQATVALRRRLDDQGAQLAALSERVDEVKVLKAQIEELKRLAMPVQVAERVR